MTREQWARISALVEAALDLPPDRRAALLDQAGIEAADREAAERLLREHDRDPAFLEDGLGPFAATVLGPPAPAVGRHIGGYRLEEEVGRGGMGIVYRAYDERLHREVAIKAVSPEFAHDEARRARLRREAQTAAALAHPGIAAVYALEEQGDEWFIVSEFIRGRTLREVLSGGALTTEALLDIACGVASALAAAHARGVVHRDLKPENIMLPDAGGVKIVDFGLARFDAASDHSTIWTTASGTMVGTPAYMAPEQVEGRPVDFRADQFAFGVVLYEAIAGVHPFASDSFASTLARIVGHDAPPLDRVAPAAELGSALAPIVARCLDKVASRRFETSDRLAEALEALRRARRTAPGSDSRPLSPPSPASVPTPAPQAALWWWRVHQLTVSAVYTLTLWPLWHLRGHAEVGPLARPMFFAALAAVVVAVTLRLHLWFTSTLDVATLGAQRQRLGRWLRLVEGAFVLLVAVEGVAVAEASPAIAVLLITIAVASALALLVIEPVTAQTAFRQ